MKFGLFAVKCRFYAFKSTIADDGVTNVMREWNYFARISAGIELTRFLELIVLKMSRRFANDDRKLGIQHLPMDKFKSD